MRVYLDNCVFNRPFDDQTQRRIRLETEAIREIKDRIELASVELCWSYIIDVEIVRNPFPLRREAANSWKKLSIYEIEPSLEVMSKAIDIRNFGFREIDSLHIACAIVSNSAYFVTTDDAILKRSGQVSQLTILDPIEFIKVVNSL